MLNKNKKVIMKRSLRSGEFELQEPAIHGFRDDLMWTLLLCGGVSPDSVFQDMHVAGTRDEIKLRCFYNPASEDLALYLTYYGTDSLWVPKGSALADYEVQTDRATEAALRDAIQKKLQKI